MTKNNKNPETGTEAEEQSTDELTDPSKRDGHPLIDDHLYTEMQDTPHEDPFVTEYGSQSNDDPQDPAVGQVSKWLPPEDSWLGKTIIDYRQAKAIALAMNIGQIFPTVEGVEPKLKEVIKTYLEVSTSINGISREQQVEVLASQFNKSRGDSEQSATMEFVTGGNDDDDDDGWF